MRRATVLGAEMFDEHLKAEKVSNDSCLSSLIVEELITDR